MFRKILLPIDGSDFSFAVINPLSRACSGDQTTVVVAEVIDPPYHTSAASEARELAENAARSQRDNAERDLAEARGLLHYGGINQVECVVLEGIPGAAIVEEAHRAGCDLIAMATHGQSGTVHPLLGSVAEYVVRNAGGLPVLLVRPVEGDEPARAAGSQEEAGEEV